MRVVFAAATLTLAFPAALHAQIWHANLVNDLGTFSRLAHEHALTTDGQGTIYVQTMVSSPRIGDHASAIYVLDINGHDLVKPYRIERLQFGEFVAQGLSAYARHSAAWFETERFGQPADVIRSFSPDDRNQPELYLDRSGGAAVHAVEVDGEGGLVVLRTPGAGAATQLERMQRVAGGGWTPLWVRTVDGCPKGSLSMQINDADLAVLRNQVSSTTLKVLGTCTLAKGQTLEFVQSRYLSSGDIEAELTYELGGSISARHRIGDGAWLYDLQRPDGLRDLVIGDVYFGTYGVSWPGERSDVAVSRIGNGNLLVSANLPDPQTGLAVSRLLRNSSTGYFGTIRTRVYPQLGGLQSQELHWSENLAGQRVLAYIEHATSTATLHIRTFAENGMELSARTRTGVAWSAVPQLRHDPLNNDFLLAVDLNDASVHIERLAP